MNRLAGVAPVRGVGSHAGVVRVWVVGYGHFREVVGFFGFSIEMFYILLMGAH